MVHSNRLDPETERNPASFLAGQRLVLWALWLTYGSFYFGRNNLGIALPGLGAELHYSKQQLGTVLMALKLAYGAGQFVNGQLAERFSPRKLLALGLLTSAALNVLFGWATSLYLLTFIWACNGYVQALGWTPTMRVAANWFPSLQRGRAIGLIGTGYQLCGALTFVVAGWAAERLGWRGALYVPAGLLVASAAHMLLVLEEGPAADQQTGERRKEKEEQNPKSEIRPSSVAVLRRVENPKSREAGRSSNAEDRSLRPKAAKQEMGDRRREKGMEIPNPKIQIPNKSPTSNFKSAPQSEVWRNVALTLTNPALWLVALALLLLDACRYGFTDWGVTHLKEVQGASVGTAAFKYAVLPFGGMAGALFSGWATDRFFGGRRAPMICLLLALLGLLTVGYNTVIQWGLGPSVTVLFLIGFCIFGPQVLLVGTFPVDLARGGTAAAAAGFVNSMGYLGAAAGDKVTGHLAEEMGWRFAIGFWAACAFAGALVIAFLWNAGAGGRPSLEAGAHLGTAAVAGARTFGSSTPAERCPP